MTEVDSILDNDAKEIRALAETCKVPELKVIEVYRSEFKRLAAQSRIETYLGVLAMRNTKSILRSTGAQAPSSSRAPTFIAEIASRPN